ncbi:MAG: methionyl-tRNA formyltransferase [Candidatus Omnitrophica bacterium]|nr:methionyl-tRNA formyltransferase [Candidatus Omnitrophota bacterium]
MNIVFFGSSEFSLAAFAACLESTYHRVVLVVTTPDRKKGRGLKTLPTPVRILAEARSLAVEAPESLKSEKLLEQVAALKPDLFVVSSYGKMIPDAWLKLPAKVALNVHPSLLPRHRGAAPINWTILEGDKETGVTIAEVTSKLDAGDIFNQLKIPVMPEANAETLSAQLADLSHKALTGVFEKIERDRLSRTTQDETKSTYARKLTKEDGAVNWNLPAIQIARQVRGLLPWPTAYAIFNQTSLQILNAKPDGTDFVGAKPGQIVEITKEEILRIQTGSGILAVIQVLPAGKKQMSAGEFARGRRLNTGFIFESPQTSKS